MASTKIARASDIAAGAVLAGSLAAGAYDSYKTLRGTPNIHKALEGKDGHKHVHVRSYVGKHSPGTHVVHTEDDLHKALDHEFKGQHPPLRKLVHRGIKGALNSSAPGVWSGDNTHIVISKPTASRAAIDHELGHIKDFTDKGISLRDPRAINKHYSASTGTKLKGLVSKKHFKQHGRYAAEVEAWRRAGSPSMSQGDRQVMREALRTYGSNFHGRRSLMSLAAAAAAHGHLSRKGGPFAVPGSK